MLSTLEEKIKSHYKQIQKSQKPHSEKCPRCNCQPKYFQRHGVRNRRFLIREKNTIKEVSGGLMRWRCSDCGRTFTDYPSFCLRHKHYIKDSLQDKCQKYVENDRISYEKLSKFVGYAGSQNEIDERKLAKSTIWRWCGNIGGRKDLCECLLDLLLKTDLEIKIYEKFFPVAKWKYRSESRKILLETLQKIFAILSDVEELLKQKIFFTDFETW